MRSYYTILALSVLLGACADSATSPSRVIPPAVILAAKGSATSAGGRIYYQADHDEPGNIDIYSMNPDGTGIVRLTTDPAPDALPSVSADGKRVAFFRATVGAAAVHVMNRDGSGVTPVFTTDADPYTTAATSGFALSPDGARIVFSGWDGSDYEVYTVNVDGTGLTQVTYNNDLDQQPRFGPKGQWIVFMSERDGDREVYTMKSDGSAVSRITNSVGNDERPEWSSDGKRIGFISGRSGESAVYSANINGTGVSRISPVGQPAYQFTWGPGGKQVAFRSVSALWVVNADGTGATSLNNASLPSWGK